MTFPQAMIWFSATAGSIFAPFAIVERFSSKDDLENYYLLLTVKRSKFSAQWYLLLSKFVDSFFGFHKVYGRVMVPSAVRVGVYTVGTTALITFGLFGYPANNFQMSFGLFSFCILGTFLFDYFNFFKTRMVLEFVTKRQTFISSVFGIFLDIILLILLYLVSRFINISIFMTFARTLPSFTGNLFGLGALDNPNMEFMGANVNVMMILEIVDLVSTVNILTASLSTIIIILFVCVTLASYLANYISVIQYFLDRHTAVLEKPLQIFGAMLVVLFAMLFWTWFGLHRLLGLD